MSAEHIENARAVLRATFHLTYRDHQDLRSRVLREIIRAHEGQLDVAALDAAIGALKSAAAAHVEPRSIAWDPVTVPAPELSVSDRELLGRGGFQVDDSGRITDTTHGYELTAATALTTAELRCALQRRASIATLEVPELVFLDTETTGLDPARHQVIEIGLLRTDIEVLQDRGRFEAKLRLLHGVEVDPRAVEVNRLDPRLAAWAGSARPAGEVFEEVRAFIGSRTVVGHNVAFDIKMLRGLATRLGAKSIEPVRTTCTKKMSERLLADRGKVVNVKLETVCKYFDVPNTGAHRAMADVVRCCRVYRRLRALERAELTAPIEVEGQLAMGGF